VRTKTPTRTPTPAPLLVSSVVINEFLVFPRSDWNNDGKVDYGDSYIELINLSTVPMSVGNWWLDDQDGDSSRFYLPAVSLQPGGRLAYFTSQTNILLSRGGDSVRLYKSNGQISDAFTYSVVQTPDRTWCRLPDGKSKWLFGCEPTVALVNKLAQSVFVNDQVLPRICVSKNLPPGVYAAECVSAGLEIWSPAFWSGQALMDYPFMIPHRDEWFIME
jgi:hypothetical protein